MRDGHRYYYKNGKTKAEFKKRRLEDEKRQISHCDRKVAFLLNIRKPQYVICSQTLGVPKEYNTSRDYTSLHKSKSGEYEQ